MLFCISLLRKKPRSQKRDLGHPRNHVERQFRKRHNSVVLLNMNDLAGNFDSLISWILELLRRKEIASLSIVTAFTVQTLKRMCGRVWQ
jgi:hypothetical protein